MENLNYISVNESAQLEIEATGARLSVRISGQGFFTGKEAFKKAAEVAQCISLLASVGIADDKIRIKNVSAQVGSGFLSKSSSATYDLEVYCETMDLLGPAVAAIASLKNSEITSVEWNYTDRAKIRQDLLQEAVRLANQSATAIATALNTSVEGVHRLSYNISGLDDKLRVDHAAYSKMSRAKMVDFELSAMSEALSLSHTANVVAVVNAEFLVNSK